MDMSDVSRSQALRADLEPGAAAESHWRDLLAQIGVEIAAPLSAALERIHALAGTGRIDRQSLRSLREEVEQARRAGMVAQQLARFASGRLRQSHERLSLSQVLQGLVAHRAREALARGIRCQQSFKPAEIIVDASLLSSLLETLLDWVLAHARTQVELRIELTPSPVQARLSARFVAARSDSSNAASGLDSLPWRLLQQTAWTMGLPIERVDDGATTRLTIDFPRTVNDALEGVSTIELDHGFAPSTNSKPLAGNHVLVLAAERELRTQVRDAVRHMGLLIDFVGSVDEAGAFCRDGLPHAIVFESALGGAPLDQLRDEIGAEVPDFVFIEIAGAGNAFQASSFSDSGMARIGRDAIGASLPSALMFELSKSL